MALDIQPLDVQPLELDIQPLDIQALGPEEASYSNEGYSRPRYQATPDGLGKKALGALEAGGSLASGFVAPFVGIAGAGLQGLNELSQGQVPNFRENAESIANALTYQPRTETGKDIMDFLEPALIGAQALGPTGYHVPAYVPPAIAMAKGKLAAAKGAATGEVKLVPKDRSAEVPTGPRPEPLQIEMFPETAGPEGQAMPYDAGQAGVVEPIAPRKALRQQELQLESPETLQVTREGVAIPESVAEPHLQARNILQDEMIAKLDAEYEAAQGERGLASTPEAMERAYLEAPPVKPVEIPSAKQVGAFRKPSAIKSVAERGIEIADSPEGTIQATRNGKVIGRLETNITPEQAKQINEPASVDIVKVDPLYQGQKIGAALYERFFEKYDGNIMPSGKTTQEAWNVWKNRYPDKVDKFVADEASRINSGAPMEQVLSNVTDKRIAQQIADKVSESMKAPTVSQWTPGGSQRKKQGGYISFPGRKPRENIRERLPTIFPETLSPEAWLEKNKNAPDSDRLTNPFTKGGLYQALKTQNPLIKRVTERFRDATNTSQAMIRDIVHDSMAPAWRSLSKDEMIKVSGLLLDAAKKEADIDLQSMKLAGYSEKAIQVVRQHQDAMKQMEGALGETAARNGLGPVHMRNAYAAAMASGDFRKLVYDGDKVVGILGDNSRRGLEKQVSKYKQLHPSARIGEERYFGGSGGKAGTTEGFQQMLEFLSQNDPDIKQFVQHANDMITASNYMNVKKHTLEKKGIFGMQGDKPFESAYNNAKDFAEAQIRYTENVIKWSEMSKAVEDAKAVMGDVDMPNAKEYLNNYMDGVLGKNPTAVGRAVDTLSAEIGKSLGIGTTMGSKVLSATKSVVNAKLLGLNPMFLATNVLQPLKVMPEMMSYLKSRGLDKGFDFGTGYASLGEAFMKMVKLELGGKVDGVTQGALDYANKNHVYSSDLFENSNSVRKDFGYYGNKTTQFGAQQVEKVTRQGVFLALTDLLHKSGVSPKQGLYEAAHNLTDIAMNNYNAAEAPLAYNTLGGAGRMSYNLMSYKHNELSRLALFARELPNNASGAALASNLMSQVAFAGVMGTLGYTEADWLVRKISEKFGKPTSLSKILLENHDELADYLKFGMFNAAGLDMTSRLGLGTIAPQDAASAVMPGLSSLGASVGSLAEAVKDPSEYNLKNAVRENVPISMAGPIDRQWFSGTSPSGKELSMNRNRVTMNAERNEADKFWKSIGGTGLNESRQKKLDWENRQTDTFYTDKRKDALLDMKKAMFTNDKLVPLAGNKEWQKAIAQYVKNQGDVANFEDMVTKMGMDLSLTQDQLAKLRNAGSSSITNLHRLLRASERE